MLHTLRVAYSYSILSEFSAHRELIDSMLLARTSHLWAEY